MIAVTVGASYEQVTVRSMVSPMTSWPTTRNVVVPPLVLSVAVPEFFGESVFSTYCGGLPPFAVTTATERRKVEAFVTPDTNWLELNVTLVMAPRVVESPGNSTRNTA